MLLATVLFAAVLAVNRLFVAERGGTTVTVGLPHPSQMLEISAKCLKKDMPLVIGLIAEQLRTPALAAEEPGAVG